MPTLPTKQLGEVTAQRFQAFKSRNLAEIPIICTNDVIAGTGDTSEA